MALKNWASLLGFFGKDWTSVGNSQGPSDPNFSLYNVYNVREVSSPARLRLKKLCNLHGEPNSANIYDSIFKGFHDDFDMIWNINDTVIPSRELTYLTLGKGNSSSKELWDMG